MGSLLAAVASYLDARAHHGRWLVRMEDLDPPREVPGAQDEILQALEAHGLHWDEEVVRQSERGTLYDAALAKLEDLGLVYRCTCSRRQVRGAVYPGTCRFREVPAEVPHSVRVKVANTRLA
ncbi:MAG: glutamate--tRNA ligase family protein, partial [Pseudomonadales bacterium]